MDAVERVEHEFRKEWREIQYMVQKRRILAKNYERISREAQKIRLEILALDKEIKTRHEVFQTQYAKFRRIPHNIRR
jgi:Iap family predicted aminopeptidase